MRFAEVQNGELETPKTWNHIEKRQCFKAETFQTLHDLKIVGR
jgi:hypothetical protein